MLERKVCANGVVIYTSAKLSALSAPHAFTTRIGGVSQPPYDTLNLAELVKGGDTDANTHVAENFRRLRAAIGCERFPRLAVRQVHGRAVWQVEPPLVKPDQAPEADAMVTAIPRRLLTIRTADCVPVLFASADGRLVGAAHAGWRGLVAGVLEHTLEVMRRQGASHIVAAIGPAIGTPHFEVGEEVARAFEDANLGDTVVRHANWPKPHIDLQAAARLALVRAGVAQSDIDGHKLCTYRDAGDFFSHRREHGRTGRMAAVIAVQ